MGRLKALKPRLQAAPSRLYRATDERSLDRRRLADTETRKLYKTKRWQDLRWSVLLRDQFTCQIETCGRLDGDTSRLVCDHVEPHRGDIEKFWAGPFQTLCKRCHDGQKQKEEIAARMAGLDVYGGKPASSRPDWLRPPLIPLTIVSGPPASGKNHYVRHHARQADLVIDLDAIAHELSGEPMHRWSRGRWLDMALRKRNTLLGSLSKQTAWPAAWLIVSEPGAQHRAWWAATMKPRAIVVIEADESTCMVHAAHDADRDQHHTRLMVRRWWSDYTRRAGDLIVRP